MGFVQADPIRAPARAQDLILRHRVTGYRAGDLERRFGASGWRRTSSTPTASCRANRRACCIRATIQTATTAATGRRAGGRGAGLRARPGVTHPADLEARFGSERAVNGWGGFSKATTRALHSLHYHGLLRVARRRDGIRVYEAAAPHPEPLTPAERSRRLVMLVLRILAPMPEASLAATFGLLNRGAPGVGGWRATVHALLRSGELESDEVDGVRYLWPAADTAWRAGTRARCVPGAVRPDRVGSPPVRASLGLALSLRGLHAAGTAPVRLLRHAVAVGRPGHRLGQCVDVRWGGCRSTPASWARGRRIGRSGTRSMRRSGAWRFSSGRSAFEDVASSGSDAERLHLAWPRSGACGRRCCLG